MAPDYPCIACGTKNGCKNVGKRSRCTQLRVQTLDLNEKNRGILKTQLLLMFTNIAPEESAAIIVNVLNDEIAHRTSHAVVDELIKQMANTYYKDTVRKYA